MLINDVSWFIPLWFTINSLHHSHFVRKIIIECTKDTDGSPKMCDVNLRNINLGEFLVEVCFKFSKHPVRLPAIEMDDRGFPYLVFIFVDIHVLLLFTTSQSMIMSCKTCRSFIPITLCMDSVNQNREISTTKYIF